MIPQYHKSILNSENKRAAETIMRAIMNPGITMATILVISGMLQFVHQRYTIVLTSSPLSHPNPRLGEFPQKSIGLSFSLISLKIQRKYIHFPRVQLILPPRRIRKRGRHTSEKKKKKRETKDSEIFLCVRWAGFSALRDRARNVPVCTWMVIDRREWRCIVRWVSGRGN